MRQDISTARPSKTTSTLSEGSSPQPGPSRRRGPQPSPPPSVIVPFPEPPVPTGDAGRRLSSVAVDATPSVVSVRKKPRKPRNARAKAPYREVPPTPSSGRGLNSGIQPYLPRNRGPKAPDNGITKDVEIDMAHRIAPTFTRRSERGRRVRDADRNIVWREHHHRDDGGQ